MKLKNRFKDEDKLRYWVDHQFCSICGSNQNCSLHHIDSTVSASIYNSSMLCHIHHMQADTHNTDSPQSEEYRRKLRDYTFRRIEREGKTRTEEDKLYLEKYTSIV